jgi:hypothetical protein
VAAVRGRNRLARGGETRRAALHSLAVVAPVWWPGLAPPAWYARDSKRVETYQRPQPAAARQALAAVIGAEGQTLRHAREAAVDPPWLPQVPAGNTLRQGWAEQ